MVREGGDKTSRAGDEESEEGGEADPSLRLPSRVLLANQRRHSESFLSFSLALGASFLSLSESQNKTRSVSSPVDIMRIFPQESQLHTRGSLFSLFDLFFFVALSDVQTKVFLSATWTDAWQKRKYVSKKMQWTLIGAGDSFKNKIPGSSNIKAY